MRQRIFALCLVAVSVGLTTPAANASTQVEALLQQAEAVRSSEPSKFQKLLAQLNSEKNLATPKQLEHVAYLNAYHELFDGHFDEALSQARVLETSPDPEMRFRAGALVVNVYSINRNFTDGLRQLGKTLALLNQVRDPELRQHGLIVAAILYNQIGQYKLSLQYAERVLSEPAPARTQCFAGQYKVDALQYLGTPAEDAAIQEVIDRCMNQHEAVVANFARTTLARKWTAQDKSDQALPLLQSHLGEVEGTHYPRLIGEVHSLIAELLLARGDLANAEQHAQSVTVIRESMANSLPLVNAYNTLYEIAQRPPDPVAALDYYRRYSGADKSYLNMIKARELAYQIVRQESLEKTQQIELLNRQNRVLQLQQKVDQTSAQNSRLLMLLASLLALALGFWAYKTSRLHASLRHLAQTDALTGVCNRHHFTLLAENSLAQCALAGEPAALLMFDLDHFKAVNDSYGHITGDWVLKRVTDTCKHFCRRMDHLGRLGGEEFAIVLHGFDLHAATRLAEDCRVKIAGIDTRDSGYHFTVTASFGVSATSLSGYDLAKLLSHADLMLYRAKREGRNRVRTYAPEMPITLRPQAAPPAEGNAHVEGIVPGAPSGHPAS